MTITSLNAALKIASKTLMFIGIAPLLPAIGLMWVFASIEAAAVQA